MPIEPKILMRYTIDRSTTHTGVGAWETVVLVLEAEGRHFPFVMSRVDAATMGHALLQAAAHAQDDVNIRAGFKS